jgi:Protein of unknown function (DUF3568)
MFHGRFLTRVLLLVVAGMMLVSTGCLAVALGTVAAGGTAAAVYMYANGRYYRDYPTRLPDAVEATRTALKELQMPIDKDEPEADKAYFESKTGDGDPIRIDITMLPNRIPAEGGVVRIGVRVGHTGDQNVSARILDQISLHLVAPVQVREGPPPGPPQRLQPIAYDPPPPPRETQAPPLAPPAK